MNKKQHTISVVIANYNQVVCLPIALQGIVEQTHLPQEIIIIDDASTDNSWKIIQQWKSLYPNLIHIYRNEQSIGMLRNLQKGYEFAKGHYIYFHSADDLIVPRCFEIYFQLLETYPEANLVASRVATFWNNPEFKIIENDHWIPETGFYSPDIIADNLRSRSFTRGQIMYRKRAIDEAGGFHFSLLDYCDWFWIHAIAFRNGICFASEILCLFRLSKDSKDQQSLLNKTTNREICNAMLKLLQQSNNEDILPFIARSGVLNQFGIGMAELVLSNPSYWNTSVFALIQQNLFSWATHNQRIRLRDFRSIQADSIRDKLMQIVPGVIERCSRNSINRIAFFGAGLHTRILYKIWKLVGGCKVVTIITSKVENVAEIDGTRVQATTAFDPVSVDAIVLSSEVYESEMAEICQNNWPNTTRMAIWQQKNNHHCGIVNETL